MTDYDRIAIIRDKLASLASELRILKCNIEDNNTDAAASVENAEDAVDEAVRHCRTALDDITYA